MKRTVTVVAKGPSAERAQEFIDACPGTAVAAVNDAGCLFSAPIDWCFFSDMHMLEWIEPHKSRVRAFVTPPLAGGVFPSWFLVKRHLMYPDRRCAGSLEDLQAKLLVGGICHHHTTPGAIHWLAKCMHFQRVRIIGVDGGRQYAKGAGVSEPSRKQLVASHQGDEDFLSSWKQITETLCGLLGRVYGVEFEWHGV